MSCLDDVEILDDRAMGEIEAERERHEAAVRTMAAEDPSRFEESERHFARLTAIYRDFIRRRMRAAGR